MLTTTTMMFCLLLMPVLVSARGSNSAFSSTHMDQLCGQTIQLNGDHVPGTFFSLTSNHYAQNLDCVLTIKAATASQRVIVVVDKMDVACGGDKLLIYDGKRDASALLNRNTSLQCGTNKYYVRTASTNTAIIEFISNADGKVGNGFVINAAINFPVPTCSQSEKLYRCRNSYCVSNLFNCNGRNWCGDNTQELACR